MHRRLENVFLISPRQDLLSSSTKKFLVPTHPFLYLKNWGVFTQIQQKRCSQTPAVARFKDTLVPTSRKYVSTEPNTRSFQ